MAKYRQERVASEILHELSGIILLEVKDPRVHDITLTDVTMSSDLSVASVRYFCAEGVDKDEVQKGIEHVMPFFASCHWGTHRASTRARSPFLL